uniref:NADH dehydrogenase subunit 6 n=1 Tax=Hygia bidentata TaxID=3106013 RepID=UPI002E7A0231|nr:NADH dehydrogenase subunit 6 [Hygia bidentata]WPV77660.1 NADH dehydrogenase subunit 6 [Hygia bidentata]
MMMLYSIMITLALNFMWLNHPVSMGILIILQTLMVSMVVGLYLSSFFFSYIIMITMLSGMLVLFIYMASVASNEKFTVSMKMIIISMLMMLIGMILQKNYMHDEMKMMLMKISSDKLLLQNMFNNKTKFITMMMIMYLLFTMMTISYIVNISEGPLRMYKN